MPETTTYVQAVVDELADRLPDCDMSLLRLYALLVFVKGTGATLEDVHDSWALWRMAARPGHPSIVPFWALPVEIQELDRPYMEAIHAVAEGDLE